MNPTLVRRTRHVHRFGRWPNVGFKNPTCIDGAVELLLFCKLIFLIGMKPRFQHLVCLSKKGRLKPFQTAFVSLAIVLQHFHNAFAQIADIRRCDAGHVDAAGAHGVNREFVFQAVNLLRREAAE